MSKKCLFLLYINNYIGFPWATIIDKQYNPQIIFNILSKMRFKKGIKNYLVNLKSAYKALVKGNFVSRLELKYLDLWINDFNLINKN